MLELTQIPYDRYPKGGGRRINRQFFLPTINLTRREAVAVLMLAGRLCGAGRRYPRKVG